MERFRRLETRLFGEEGDGQPTEAREANSAAYTPSCGQPCFEKCCLARDI